jgi:universal stress protein E
MRPIRSILVPVRKYSARSLPIVNKAAQLAAAFSANLELFHDMADPIMLEELGRPGYALRSVKADTRRSAIEGLERLAEPLRARGLTVSTSAAWDYPPYEAIVRRAVAIGADLIVAPRRERHRVPALLGYTDWELLRLSPVPVLLAKTSKPYRRPTVLAAIDPTHAHAKPSALDQRILAYGAQVGRALRGALHVVHAYLPQPLPPTVTFDTKRRKSLLAQDEREARQTFYGALVNGSIPAARRHLVRGEPLAGIPATARKTHSAIVVMGAVSRSALKRLFIGNTAEKVMDELRCDLLVVKPAKFGFKKPRARRGPRFVSTAVAPL